MKRSGSLDVRQSGVQSMVRIVCAPEACQKQFVRAAPGSFCPRILGANSFFKLTSVQRVGPVAQRLEQRTHNPLVPGSNPGGPTNILCCQTGGHEPPLFPRASLPFFKNTFVLRQSPGSSRPRRKSPATYQMSGRDARCRIRSCHPRGCHRLS
jgi:hypothetical protein